VLTRTVAQKLFGTENPFGQSLPVDNDAYIQVTGVMEDVPPNSQFNFNGLISMATMRNMRSDIFGARGYVDFYTYLH
jgi:putative ABC transport system permease protein